MLKSLFVFFFASKKPAMAWPLSCLLFFYLAVFLLQSSPTYSQNSGKISVGQSLLAKSNGTSLLSPAGDFAFGFHQAPNNTDLYLLSVWYATIPETIVWYANGGNPVPQGSTLNLTVNEGLVLSNPLGTVLWSTTDNLSGDGAVSYGFMNDTGNFALINSVNAAPLWQTFDYPTDTLLPTQTLETVSNVISRISENNLTEGRFQLYFNDGDLVLNMRDVASGYKYIPYKTFGSQSSNGEKLVYSESGDMFILNQNGSKIDLIQSGGLKSSKDYYQRVTLEFDGVLIWYYYPRNSTGKKGVGWSKFQSIPDNICETFPEYSGACGYNSICSLGKDKRPVCQCPPKYSLMDPTNSYGSCEPDFNSDFCGKFEDGGGVKGRYTLIQLQNTDWPRADYAQMSPFTEDECKESCMNDCFCGAAISDGSSTCWKKKLPLSYGNQDSTVLRTGWLKVSHDNGTSIPVNPFIPPRIVLVEYKWNAVAKGLLGSSVCVNFILLSVVGFGIFFVYNTSEVRGHSISEYSTAHSFTYKELESATNGFRDEIGRGSFGVVYKGNITTGGNQYSVAVKRLDRTFKGADKEFTAEVNVIGLTHHKNLVRFIGYCKEEDERLLVYEYMSNGTVADYLLGHIRPSWVERVQIGQGIARGLLYLHEECTTQIIHCDIKPHNVLVDDHHNARISDFGLAKLLVLNQNHTNTAVRGTKGYLAPEWFKNKPVSVKVDVYSFGVLLLEIICCRRCVRIDVSTDECEILTDWAFDCYQSETLDCLVKDDMEALNDRPQLERLVKVALWCIQENPDLRPTMKRVTQMLEGIADVPSPPCPTSFSVNIPA